MLSIVRTDECVALLKSLVLVVLAPKHIRAGLKERTVIAVWDSLGEIY